VALAGLTCTATLSWPGGAHRWRFAGDVGPDTVERVGTLQLEAPEVEGEVVLDLDVTGDGLPEPVRNRDTTVVTP
jgi:hypothetical protein